MISTSNYNDKLSKWLSSDNLLSSNKEKLINKEQAIYNNTVSYLNKAVQELKKIDCQCTDNNYCDRCCLLDDIQSLLFDVNKKIL